MDELFREARYVLNSAGVWEKPGYQPLSYTDGVDAEERIAALLEQVSDRSVLSDELRPLCTDWPATYHLSHARANLLRPLERFLRGADVLEVGAGCGAITRYLGELGARVVALEGSPRRARAARSRARELANVSVVAEQFGAFRWPRAFDVVTLIGVFEYAGRFEPGPDPWVSMLACAREHLTDGGLLLLAIENQLGLKYLLGAAEDHLGVTGYGIESQYQPGEPRTFGWRRLSEVLTRAGFGARTVLLPLPDYKLPRSVLSEAGIADATLAAASLASQSVPHDRLFRHGGHAALERVWPTVAENGLMLELANSFLVVAANGGAVPSLDALAWHYSTDRRRAFCKTTRFVRKGAAIEVEAALLDPGARDPEGPLRFDPPKRGRYVCGAPLATKAVRLLTRPHWRVEELVAFFAEYRDCLTAFIGQTGASVERGDVPGEWVDALPQNIVVAPDTGATLIDREWTMGGAIPFGFLVFRSILALSDSVTRVGESDDPRTRTLLGLVESVFDGLGLEASAETLGRYLELESQIQRQVKGVPGEVTLGDLAAAELPVAPPADHRNCVPVATVNATLRGLAGESPALRGHISSSAYAISNPDVAAAGLDPVAHWLEQGYREGRVPTPALDALVDDLTAEAEAKAQASARLEAEVARLEQYLERRDAEARSLEQLLAARDQQLAAVYASTSWRVTKGIRVISRVARRMAPPYAPGGRVFRAARRLYRAAPLPLRVKHRGRHAWIARLFRYRTGAVAQPSTSPLTVDSPADGRREWISYAQFKARLVAHADGERARFSPAPPELRVIAEGDVRSAASRIQFPSAATPLVTIIVPVFGGVAMAVECLASLAHAKVRASFEVIVADDASPDGTADILAQVQGIRLRRNTINLGFIRNCNHAMADARGAYTLILNSDVQVSDGWLDALVEVFDTRPDAGAVGPKILYPSGHLQEAGVALRPDATSNMVGLNDDADRACYSYIRPVDYCSGAALMVRTATLRQLGGFDERLSPAYCEDADFCLRLRRHGLKTYYTPRAVVVHHLSRTMTSLSPEWKRWQIATNLATFTREWAGEIASLSHVRVLAFYLPQFHTIPENDAWWGAGFTEWTNVRRARPNFAGHYQPREPAELGYYDLNDPAAMDRQVALARRYGVDGFVYYYYWFGGRRLLEMPLERLLATGRPDYPYCLCWANENWSRRWDGRDQEILIGQSHTPEDDRAVIRDIARHFASARYIRIDRRPLVLVYRVELFPDFRATAARWRDVCRAEGHGEIYLAYVESHDLVHKGLDPSTFGCDAAVEFPPLNMAERTGPGGPILNPRFQGGVADYADTAFRFSTRELPGYTRFRGVTPGWDNTPRRQDHGFVLHGSTPGVFQAWLEHVIAQTRAHRHGDERLVFVNAWNEWAEGAYLEPDRVFGHTYLEAVRNARDAERLLRLGGYELSA